MSSLQETAKETQTKDTIQTEGEKVTVEDNITQPSSTAQEEVTATETQDLSHLPENVRILKEAFPDIDVEVIETILQIQGNSVDSAFELLLGMSDPNYKSTPPTVQEEVTPPMPPRPNSFISETRRSNSGEINAPYASWEGQQQQQPVSVEEQLRLDEEFAKKLAMEEESRNERRRMKQYQQKQQQQRQQKREADSDDDSLFNLQEELPIIKEKMIEAGNAAKKKMMDFYNQIKANTRHNNSNPNHQFDASSASTMPTTTNAQYRGLPSDDGDDLLTGDVSALHLSDYDVYAQTGGRQIRKSNDTKRGEDNNNSSSGQTSTSNAQLKSDEDFARQLYEEEQLEARKSSQENNNTPTLRPPQSTLLKKSTTPTVVIAPRSPLEFEGDSDYEGLSVTSSSNLNSANNNKGKNSIDNTITEESSSVPYVIGDDDDSDSDDLVDIDEDELFDDDYEEEEDIKTNTTKNKVIAVTEEQDNKKEDTTTTTNTNAITTTTTTTTNNK